MVGEATEPVKNYDLLTVIVMCLGKPNGENYDGVLRLLDVLLGSEADVAEKRKILQEDYDIPMTQAVEEEVSVMCNLSKGVMEKGMARGRAEGMANGILTSIEKLVKNLGVSTEQAMSVLEIPENERQKYRELLEQQ